MNRVFSTIVLLAGAAVLGWAALALSGALPEGERAAGDVGGSEARAPVPVELGPVERGPVTLRRTFSGALEAAAEMVVAPKAAGRVRSLEVDLGDPVARGQVVASLDDDEFVQAVKQAEAELAVARANRTEAESALEIAERALRRAETLRADGVASESELDAARTQELARRASVEVARANVARAEAAVESARIRLGYTRVTADWSVGDDERLVASRMVDEGDTVSPNTPLLSIVELDPIVAVVDVPERDYARLAVGQTALLGTDAWPGETFEGRIQRIAPVFRRSTRQARVELIVPNADERLKPGMFARATLELERIAEATVVPFEALTERDGRRGVFVLAQDGATVAWRPVEVGVREGERVQVHAEDLSGNVVVLGQELCDDGAPVVVVGDPPATGPEGP